MDDQTKPEHADVQRDRRSTDQGLGGRVLAIEAQLANGGARMASIEAELSKNTEVTTKVLEIITTAEGFFKVCGLIGRLIKWLLAIGTFFGAVWSAWKHH